MFFTRPSTDPRAGLRNLMWLLKKWLQTLDLDLNTDSERPQMPRCAATDRVHPRLRCKGLCNSVICPGNEDNSLTRWAIKVQNKLHFSLFEIAFFPCSSCSKRHNSPWQIWSSNLTCWHHPSLRLGHPTLMLTSSFSFHCGMRLPSVYPSPISHKKTPRHGTLQNHRHPIPSSEPFKKVARHFVSGSDI